MIYHRRKALISTDDSRFLHDMNQRYLCDVPPIVTEPPSGFTVGGYAIPPYTIGYEIW